MKPKRYYLFSMMENGDGMHESENGDYVEYADYEKLHTIFEQTVKDQCEDDLYIREQAKRVLPATAVDGDTVSVPGTCDIVDMLVERCEKLANLSFLYLSPESSKALLRHYKGETP